MILGDLFRHPLPLQYSQALWLILPLSLSAALVYKTIRTRRPGRLWLEVLGAFGYVVAGLVVLAAALWVVQAYWP